MYNWEDYRRETPEWFRDAKFGLFFHWGPYCVPEFGGEWYSRNMYDRGHEQNLYHKKHFGSPKECGYKDLIPKFSGEKFDAAEWANLVELAGAKYAGPVTEHADNFSLWDSQVNPVNALRMGPKRDVVGECYTEFRKKGIRALATFHHQWFWGWYMGTETESDAYDPANCLYYGKILPLETNRYIPNEMPDSEFCTIWRDKVLEVIFKYSPDVVYFDSRANIIPDIYKQQICDALYRKPDTVITYKQFDFPEGCATVDIECGRFSEGKPFPWQTDDRLEDLPTWCYNRNPRYKDPARIIHQLCDVVAKNGNLLLNIGPKSDGTFAPEGVQVLGEVGDWLRKNGRAIYGTRPWRICMEGPTAMRDNNFDEKHISEQIELGYMTEDSIQGFSPKDIRFTQKDGVVYAIALGVPEDGTVFIRSMGSGAGSVSRVFLPEGPVCEDWSQDESGLKVRLPGNMPQKYACVIGIEGIM